MSGNFRGCSACALRRAQLVRAKTCTKWGACTPTCKRAPNSAVVSGKSSNGRRLGPVRAASWARVGCGTEMGVNKIAAPARTLRIESHVTMGATLPMQQSAAPSATCDAGMHTSAVSCSCAFQPQCRAVRRDDMLACWDKSSILLDPEQPSSLMAALARRLGDAAASVLFCPYAGPE